MRFWDYITKSPGNGCWMWTAALDKKGYGRFGVDGTSVPANRVAWILTHGDPGTLFVCHTCDNPPCVRPEHQFLGTCKDNLRDSIRKNGHVRAKLTPAKVREARVLYRRGYSFWALAQKYGVTALTVKRAIEGVTWKILVPIS